METKMKYRIDCADNDLNVIQILKTAFGLEWDNKKASRYAEAIRAIGEAYLERVGIRIKKVEVEGCDENH